MSHVAQLVAKLADDVGVAPTIAQIAFATLADNALEHGDERSAPTVGVYLCDAFLSIRTHDSGCAVSGSAQPKWELRRRIQVPVEEVDPSPGAPVGIAWLVEVLRRRCPGSELDFTAGDGRPSWHDGIWVRSQVKPISGFLAIAHVAL